MTMPRTPAAASQTWAVSTTITRVGRIIRAIAREPVGIAALTVLGLLAILVILAPLITPYDPVFQDRRAVLKAPGAIHWFGTDDIGRDVFARVLFGTRISMYVGIMVVVVTSLIGTIVGLLSGYIGGWVDAIVQRVVEALDTLPSLVLALFVAALLGPSVTNVVLAVSLAQIPRFIRVVRSEAIKIRQNDYVAAARVIGASSWRIVITHGLPNALPTILVLASLCFGTAIMTEAALSFLGVGTPPPAPSLGTMLSHGTRFMDRAPWLIIFPGLMLSISVLALNLLGDALRDALDPRNS